MAEGTRCFVKDRFEREREREREICLFSLSLSLSKTPEVENTLEAENKNVGIITKRR